MGATCSKKGSAQADLLGPENLQHNLVFDQNKELEDVYQVVEVIGEGSISWISKIKKREVGGTARRSIVEKRLHRKEGIDESFRSDTDFPEVFFALKEINLDLVKKEYIDEIENEIHLLKGLDHPNIIKAYETFKRKNRMAIVMEICTGGDLNSRSPYSERQAADIVGQILSAVAYLHDRNIVHRDLKHENIMFGSDTTDDIKLIDFGLAKKFMYTREIHHERVGSIYTMSPEVMSGKYSGASADMWSVGVIMYMLLSSEMPFYGSTPKAVINQVRNCEVVYDGRAWKNISDDSIDLINNLLKKDPKERLTANAALDHPFIVKRKRLSTSEPNPQLVDHIGSDLQRYADTTEFKKIALLAMANRMSSSEIVELRKIFSEFDENHHGTISKAEFKKALFNHGKYTEAEFESMFAGIDVNHTGSILYTEFLAATLEAQGNISQHKIAECFDELDEDDTGYISKENLRKILPKTMTSEEIDKLIADIDTDDGDGKISFQEFRKAFTDDHHSKMGSLYDAT